MHYASTTAITTVALQDHIMLSIQVCFLKQNISFLLWYLEIYAIQKRLYVVCVDSGNLKTQDTIQVNMVSSWSDLFIFSLVNTVFTGENSIFRGFLSQFPQLNHVTFCWMHTRPELLENRFWLCIGQLNFKEILDTFFTWWIA